MACRRSPWTAAIRTAANASRRRSCSPGNSGSRPGARRSRSQSRFGRARWLQPYTAATLEAWAREGVRRVDVVCPGFVWDPLETLEEIGIEGRRSFLAAGGREFHLVPCLNESHDWIGSLADLAQKELGDWIGAGA